MSKIVNQNSSSKHSNLKQLHKKKGNRAILELQQQMRDVVKELSLCRKAHQGGGSRRGRTPPRAPPKDFNFSSSHGEENEGQSFNDSEQEDPFLRRMRLPRNNFQNVKVEPSKI